MIIKTLFFLLFITAGPVFAHTDPKIAKFLEGMNKYYYCLARQGVSSLQADVTASMDGDVLYQINKDGKNPPTPNAKYLFHFSYLGNGMAPVMSAVTVVDGSTIDYMRLLRMSKLAYDFTKMWGGFTTNPLFYPSDPHADYSYSKTSTGFKVDVVEAKVKQTIWFDSQGLAKWVEYNIAQKKLIMKLGFDHSPQGPVVSEMDIVSVNGGKDPGIGGRMDYQMVNGLRLPMSLTLWIKNPTHPLQLTFNFSNYRIHQKQEQASYAPQTDYQVIPAEGEAVGAKHFLWKVTSSTATVYLLGSIHIRGDSPLPIPAAMEQAYQASSYVGFEYDLSKQDEVAKGSIDYMRKNEIYPAGDDLIKHLTPEVWQIVKSMIVLDGFDLSKAVHMKPNMLASLLGSLAYQKAGLDPNMGVDQIFFRRAQRDKKTVFGLEFWWKPVVALDSMSEDAQVHNLIGSVAGDRYAAKNLSEILDIWKSGNAEVLNTRANSTVNPQEKEVMNRIIRERNDNWMVQLKKLLAAHGTYLIIVGSAHLVGQGGLPELLQAQGYTIEQQ